MFDFPIARWFLILACMAPLQACSNSYSAKPIEAWVVDAETKQPVEGVNVVAHWELSYGLEGGGSDTLTVSEAVTDKNGRFYFQGWGPKEVPKHLPSEARLKNRDPVVIIFKSGYRYLELVRERDNSTEGGRGSSTRNFFMNGQKIELSKFKGDDKEYAKNIRFLNSGVMSTLGSLLTDPCSYENIPRMIITLDKELYANKDVIRDGYAKYDYAETFYSKLITAERNHVSLGLRSSCRPPEKFFSEYIK